MTPEVGAGSTIVGRYAVGDVVGRGGMGQVRAGHDLRLDREVAIKLLNPDVVALPKACERFEAEARAAARLTHPNIVIVYDSGEHEGVLFLAARVNLSEADFFANHCVVAASSLGSLIQTAVGSAGGSGGLRTKRSGCSA